MRSTRQINLKVLQDYQKVRRTIMWKGWKFHEHQFRGYGLEDPNGKIQWIAITPLPEWLSKVKESIEKDNQ